MFTVRPIEQGRPLAVSRAALLARAIATSSSRTGKHGRPSKCTLFNAPPQPSKAATAIWRGCITSSGACPNGATRCGQPCITSTFVLRMARHQPHAFSSTRSLTSLKQCTPMSALYRSPGNGNASLCSGIDVMKLSRLKWIPGEDKHEDDDRPDRDALHEGLLKPVRGEHVRRCVVRV
jgi:hypothetical protein